MSDTLVTEITRRAMATTFGVVVAGRQRQWIEAAVDALDQLHRLEALMSVYRPASDISRVNQAAGTEPVRIDPSMITVLNRAGQIHQLTGGAFDITAGPLVQAWGFMRRRGKKPNQQELEQMRRLVDGSRLQIDPARSTAFLPTSGMSINLGGIGKGFALDRMAQTLVNRGVTDFLIHGGRSSVIARGSDHEDKSIGWGIAIEHPTRPGVRLGRIRLCDAALATSGSGKQFFHHRGRRLGHVIDPRTGYPAGDMLAISVITELAADADALSTACFVDGLERTRGHLAAGNDQPETAPASGAGSEPRWPIAAIAVISGKRQADVEAITLGDTRRLRWQAAPTVS